MASELQRARLLEATFAVVGEGGFGELTVGRVAGRARVSRRTFYEEFSDREDCFLAAFDHGLDVLAERVRPAFESEREWPARVRAGLGALLACLDGEPALRRLVFVEALAAGPRVLERRTEVLEQLAAVIDGGRAGGRASEGLPLLVAEGLVGAVFGVIYARVSQRRPEPLVDLLDSLTATIVFPYRGRAAGARELERYAPAGRQTGEPDRPVGWRGVGGLEMGGPAGLSPGSVLRAPWDMGVLSARGISGRPLGSALPADFRLTVRTQMVLTAIARLNQQGAGPTNRVVSEEVGINGKGQTSKLLSRLQGQGLIEDTGGRGRGAPRAWRLTGHGEAVLDAHRPLRVEDLQATGGGKLSAKRGRPRLISRAGPGTLPAEGLDLFTADKPASAGRPGENLWSPRGFRLTVRTHLVLTAVAEHPGACNREIAAAAGIRDQGQISKLLARLQDRGLVRNTAHATAGYPKAWHLTPRGEALVISTRALSGRAA